MTPSEILAGYYRVRGMARAIAALTDKAEYEVVRNYERHLAAGGLAHTPEASPEAYTALIRALGMATRAAPVPPAEEPEG